LPVEIAISGIDPESDEEPIARKAGSVRAADRARGEGDVDAHLAERAEVPFTAALLAAAWRNGDVATGRVVGRRRVQRIAGGSVWPGSPACLPLGLRYAARTSIASIAAKIGAHGAA